MTDTDLLIGEIVADIARTEINRSSAGGGRPGLRISGFSEREVVAIAARLDGLQVPGRAAPATVKVGTRRSIEGLPANAVLSADETLTKWRNADVSALIIIDLDPQGDEAGLRGSLHQLNDQNVLTRSPGDTDGMGDDIVLRHAWRMAGRQSRPQHRLESGLEVIRQAVTQDEGISLRRWVRFVWSICTDLSRVALLTPGEIDRVVGRRLAVVGMFPDSLLFLDERSSRSRLVKNLRSAALRQPTGAQITEDDLLMRIESVRLDERLVELTGELSEAAVREAMREVVRGEREAARQRIELEVWLQLFERRAQDGLGAQIRSRITSHHPTRLEEFDELEVEPGLDRSEQDAAERLVNAEPADAAPSIVELLPAPLRRRVEKLAYPDARIEPDPLRALLHSLHVLHEVPTSQDGEAEPVASKVSLVMEGPPEQGRWTRWLFRFLYGRVLDDVVEQSSSGIGLALTIDQVLREAERPPDPEDNEEFEPSVEWAPLRLAVSIPESGIRRFRWDPQSDPGLVALAAVIFDDNLVCGYRLDTDFETWCESLLDPRRWGRLGDGGVSAMSGPTAEEFAQIRARRLRDLRDGFAPETLDDYLNEWEVFLGKARDVLVPHNSPLPELKEVVLTDVVELPGDRLVMLATHPLRLRWIVSHLHRMTELLVRALADGLSLNPENTELFFDWLDRVSPHGLPPFVVGADEVVAVAVREYGWHEEYAAVRRDGGEDRDWLANVDDTAVDEMVSVIVAYLDSYPHKRDGVVVLLLSRDGSARLPVRLVQRLRGRVGGVRVELNLCAPRATHHDIVQAFEDTFGDEETAPDRLFPDVQLVLKGWAPDEDPPLAELRDRVDIALAPAVFGTRTSLKNLTRSPNASLSGGFDAWISSPFHDLAESSENVVRVLLPTEQDPVLEAWSTLCVRHEAHSPVAPQEDANTDYFALQVRFDRQQRVFTGLHEVAHWVVTLDSFIGRDQIDALPDRPDVILVRTGVGKNEAYTLIVSSMTGRRFVVDRLRRKLHHDLRLGDELPIDELALRLYEVGRNVVPGAVLRALGLGRAAHEILGLVVSRHDVARSAPVDRATSGMEVWISFDEHLGWFGRTQRMRADLGRFVFTVEPDGAVRLAILVVESKFRRTEDLGAAESQLDRTVELCANAFGRERAADTKFWWRELAAAVEQESKIGLPPSELPARSLFGPAAEGAGAVILQAIRAGQVELTDIGGVAVAISSDLPGPAPGPTRLGRHVLHRVHHMELLAILKCLLAHEAPATGEETSQIELSGTIADTATPADLAIVDSPAGWREESEPERRSGGTSAAAVVPTGSGDTPAGRGLGELELRGRYERLLDVFSQHNVPVAPPEVGAWDEGPGFYVLRVVPRPGVTVDRVMNRVSEIQLALSLPAESRVRAIQDRGAIVFEVPKATEERYPVLTSLLWPRSPLVEEALVVPLGEDIQGRPVTLEFSSPDSPHLLVAGTTGSGKSVALEAVLHALCRYSAERISLFLVDPKGTELLDFADDPRVVGQIGMDAQDAIAILEESVEEMQRRYGLFRTVRARSLADYNRSVSTEQPLPWRVVVLDEYADLTSDPDDKTSIERLLRRLAQKARAAGIHIIVATQRPSADVVSTTIRSNFPAQLALRVKTATDSRIILDETGAETLAGQGDAFLRTARGMKRLQVAYFDF
ncbi:FtsK/SpoIIIE family protein [Pseudonocardia hierapolitana]|uniref:FtsK/SpoIIIE family protein n=1 Tax=Pseudonocardia hierapolitana TaxID=1128676 RepID=A0A561SL67_9PSEU|nr:FtsK/SpoIIIE domain-containing protein [Pseudonocardia hierapolitana]TWF75624.1 FtsK/SpoIIIE family protein [Pseudonocardia hierapolitana]